MQSSSTDISSKKKPLVLAVDDDRALRMMLVSMLEELGCDVLEAKDGKQAMDIIEERKKEIDTILLDREMPVMNGMEVVKTMKGKKDLRNLPIIMQTGSDKPEQIKQGIDAGVFYYLTKPVNQDILKSVLMAAIRESEQHRNLLGEMQKQRTGFALIETCKFQLKTLPEAEHLAIFLANCFPDPERTVGGLAELLINAVEHGNLGISYTEKTWLVNMGTWREEIEKRLLLPEHNKKKVEVSYRHKPEGFYVTVKDEGKGFDWRNFMQIDPSRATDNHGRGVAQANAISFDKITYNEIGNEVTAFTGNAQTLEW